MSTGQSVRVGRGCGGSDGADEVVVGGEGRHAYECVLTYA